MLPRGGAGAHEPFRRLSVEYSRNIPCSGILAQMSLQEYSRNIPCCPVGGRVPTSPSGG